MNAAMNGIDIDYDVSPRFWEEFVELIDRNATREMA